MKYKQLKRNMLEVVTADGYARVLVSYETPVAVHRSGELPYVTETRHSATTARHIKEWLKMRDCPEYERVSQESIERMAANLDTQTNPVPTGRVANPVPTGRVPKARQRNPRHYAWVRGDVGVYADGAGGHEYVRERLAEFVEATGRAKDLVAELRADPSDDMSEEEDALEVLQGVTQPGLQWGFSDGDLVLQTDEWWEEGGP